MISNLLIIYLLMLFLNASYIADDLKIYLEIRRNNIVDMQSDFSGCKRDIDTIISCCFMLGIAI